MCLCGGVLMCLCGGVLMCLCGGVLSCMCLCGDVLTSLNYLCLHVCACACGSGGAQYYNPATGLPIDNNAICGPHKYLSCRPTNLTCSCPYVRADG